ncbi:MAG: anti-sigma F factor, partial [Oscillospiraceae bacterium]
RISFLSKSANEGFSRIAVSGLVSQLDPQVDELSDIKTAVSEAVTNAIVHAYNMTVGKIDMNMRILEGNVVYIRIKDYGCGIPDIKRAMEPLFTTAPEDERAGLGFAVMESFMDRLTVRSKVGKGTTVVLTKKIKSRRVSDE